MIEGNSIEFGYKKSFSHFFFLIYTKIRFSQKLQFLIVDFHRLIRHCIRFQTFAIVYVVKFLCLPLLGTR